MNLVDEYTMKRHLLFSLEIKKKKIFLTLQEKLSKATNDAVLALKLKFCKLTIFNYHSLTNRIFKYHSILLSLQNFR